MCVRKKKKETNTQQYYKFLEIAIDRSTMKQVTTPQSQTQCMHMKVRLSNIYI